MATPKLRLTYFDMHGGRGEAARLALNIGGVDFEDNRISFAESAAIRRASPFGRLPVLEIDGEQVTHSNGINRFVGKLTDLYPSDPVQAAFCDEAMGAVEDITIAVISTFSIQDEDEKKAAREQLAEGPLTLYLERMQALLQKRGGEYFADGRLTVADLKVFVWVRGLRSGNLDYVPTDLSDKVAPLLVEHFERINNHPKIREYYARA
jgi:glutathione S-transferase